MRLGHDQVVWSNNIKQLKSFENIIKVNNYDEKFTVNETLKEINITNGKFNKEINFEFYLRSE